MHAMSVSDWAVSYFVQVARCEWGLVAQRNGEHDYFVLKSTGNLYPTIVFNVPEMETPCANVDAQLIGGTTLVVRIVEMFENELMFHLKHSKVPRVFSVQISVPEHHDDAAISSVTRKKDEVFLLSQFNWRIFAPILRPLHGKDCPLLLHMPQHIVSCILSYLRASDICTVSKVAKPMQVACDEDQLWNQLLQNDFTEDEIRGTWMRPADNDSTNNISTHSSSSNRTSNSNSCITAPDNSSKQRYRVLLDKRKLRHRELAVRGRLLAEREQELQLMVHNNRGFYFGNGIGVGAGSWTVEGGSGSELEGAEGESWQNAYTTLPLPFPSPPVPRTSVSRPGLLLPELRLPIHHENIYNE
mmetsp:Transcript_16915/g.28330  ORF Transcript_16915/g.28330 Transcript_16915/m.28330 type:complete len:357 (-) Transcript_16915:384-1454(-)